MSSAYVNISELQAAMQAPTTVSLEAATEAAKDGIELLQTFIKLAKSEKKKTETAKEV